MEKLLTDEDIIVEVPSSNTERFFNEMNFNVRLFDISIILSLINCSNPYRQFTNSLELYKSVSFDMEKIILTLNHTSDIYINEQHPIVIEITKFCSRNGINIIHMPYLNDIEKHSSLRAFVNGIIKLPDPKTLSTFRLNKLKDELRKIDNLILMKNKSITYNCVTALDEHLNKLDETQSHLQLN